MRFERKKEGFRLFGLGKQEFIKYFFGGNASLAIFILVLICAFLLKEAWLFFPGHHEQLKVYRKSGLEYFTLVEKTYQDYKIDTGGLNRAYQAEIAFPNAETQELMSSYESTRIYVEKQLGDQILVLRDAIKQRKNATEGSPKAEKLDKVIASLKQQIDGRRSELRDSIYRFKLFGFIPIKRQRVLELNNVPKADREKIIDAVVNLNFWERGEASYYDELEEKYDETWDTAADSAEPLRLIYNKYKKEIAAPLDKLWKDCSQHTRSVRDRVNSNVIVPKQIAGQVNVGLANKDASVKQTKFGAVLGVVANAEYFDEYARVFYLDRFTQVLKGLKPQDAAYDGVPAGIREKSEAILAAAETDKPEFIEYLKRGDTSFDAFPKAVPDGSMDAEMRQALFELTKLKLGTDKTIRKLSDESINFISEFPFDQEAEKVRAFTPRFQQAVSEIKAKGIESFSMFPDTQALKSEAARDELDAFKKEFVKNIDDFEEVGEKLEEWKFYRPWTWRETAGAFFFGKTWTNNSQIQDRYGILPMFTGSLIISVLALTISVPISVAAAVYVNQIAPFREQNFLKPTIEFIGAIPSVVLGFLGIVVVGQMIKEFGDLPIVSWVPGFPFSARLNMLTAGLLLAFMSIPIIFTLAEDALNNVPSAFRDSSLSLGATRLQTAFRVILPASLSGVIAAILLGFGRVIGETMVVLLVAGNRIAIPDFSKGLGVVTEPSHTLTGIIAQNLGEASKGSVDYRALFMVGLVLFVITLTINYIGQRILIKYQAAK